ncbi:GTA-gp10 family protein [Ketogulonicigenium vulgare]|uniref:GTA-gp10 family protein n=1 Tax=Ketogulonicigenium vulgare TaxID=92945 RepID=UPI002358703D|nr:GTA-gp10 family protein [Ketogulonicigenium vulgare]
MAEPRIVNWACGEHAFRLRIGEAEALDDLTPQGVADLRYRLRTGLARGGPSYAPVKVREMVDCLRLGLVGAGMDAKVARELALRGIEEADFAEVTAIAYHIVTDFLSGKDHDQPEKTEAAEATDLTSA